MRRFSPRSAAIFLLAAAVLAIYTWFAAIPMQRSYTGWLLSDQLPAGTPALDGDDKVGEGSGQGGGCGKEIRAEHKDHG